MATCCTLEAGDIGPPVAVHAGWESRYHALSMPAPHPPYEARRQHLTVSGIISVEVDRASGLVTRATMKKSTGSSILDQASVNVTKEWRFRPNGPSHLDVPVTFDIKGSRLE
jgi:TonB family protein